MREHEPKVLVSPPRASRILRPLINATEEKDIEHAWRTLLEDGLKKAVKQDGGTIGDGFVSTIGDVKTDGYMTVTTPTGNYGVLLETKIRKALTGPTNTDTRAKILTQVTYYVHNLSAEAKPSPKVIIVADEDEVFLLDGDLLTPLANQTWDDDPKWEATPSRAYDINTGLYNHLRNLQAVATMPVYEVTNPGKGVVLDADTFIKAVRTMGQGGTCEIMRHKVTVRDLEKEFQRFHLSVFSGVTGRGASKKQMAVFTKTILGDDTIKVKDPRRNTCTITTGDGKTLTVNAMDGFNALEYKTWRQEHACGAYTPQERQDITSICDRLLEDAERRWTGEFWTPEIWADRMRTMVADHLGEDWTSKYVIWDPACGSKNLTQGATFGRQQKNENLYLSTLFSEELSIAEGINPGATVFQHDFLNDPLEPPVSPTEPTGVAQAGDDTHSTPQHSASHQNSPQGATLGLPAGLLDALKANKPIIILGNPPYGTSGDPRSNNKTGVADTTTRHSMIHADAGGHAAQELYAQFYYRAAQIARHYGYTSNFHIVFFSKVFMTSPAHEKFLNNLTSDFTYQGGFMLNSGEFNGASRKFPIICSHWTLDTTPSHEPQASFDVQVLKTQKTRTDVTITDAGTRTIRHVQDHERLSKMIPTPTGDHMEYGTYPVTSNGFHDTNSTSPIRGRWTHGALGYLQKRDSVGGSYLRTSMLTTARRHGDGIIVDPGNFTEACMIMGVLKAAFLHIRANKELWVRDKDIFTRLPEQWTRTPGYKTFQTDAVIYSLFTTGSYQTSLSNYQSQDQQWDIRNQFFPLTNQFMQDIANHNLDDGGHEILQAMQQDHQDRYAATWIQRQEKAGHLTSEAKDLLNTWSKIIEASFKYRIIYANTPRRTEQGLERWDAGFMQIHRMCRSDDRFLLDAKIDKNLQALWDDFDQQHAAIGERIWGTYTQHTGF